MSNRVASNCRACLVISHYNAWPTDQLVALLDQAATIPAGEPFHTRVVVNQAVPKPLRLPARHGGVEVLYRPNAGYNIGAWDHGWRSGAAFDFYLFLQEECIIRRDRWMSRYRAKARPAKVGLVGESLVLREPWRRLRGLSPGWRRAFDYPCGSQGWYIQMEEAARARGIELGRRADHLQSLIFAARRDVLERIDGFESTSTTHPRAVISEILASKAVTTRGLALRQAGFMPFSIIAHPQWTRPRWRELVQMALLQHLPPKLKMRVKGRVLGLASTARRAAARCEAWRAASARTSEPRPLPAARVGVGRAPRESGVVAATVDAR